MNQAIVIVGKTLSEKVLDYYNNLDINSKIYVVTPDREITEFKYKNLLFYNDNYFLKISDSILKTHRPGWYFQQFLKLKIVLKLKEEIVHIIDGDSILNSELIHSNKFYYTSKKIDIFYSNFNRQYNKIFQPTNLNFIVNHMVYEKKKLKLMLTSLGMSEKNFISKICEKLEDGQMWFSEYQTYALFVLNNFNEYKIEKIKVFRRFDLVFFPKIKSALKSYSLISFEKDHKSTMLHILWFNLLYILRLNNG